LFLVLAVLLLRSGGMAAVAGIAGIVCGCASAAFNVAANLAVLRVLDVPLFETTGAMINSIRSAAFASWALAGITVALLSAYFFRFPQKRMRAIGILLLITALMQLYGLRDGQFLVLASVPAALALVGIAVTTLVLRSGR